MKNISDWQKRFRSGNLIWVVIDSDGYITGIYETKEAALCEIKWRNRCKKNKGYTIQSDYIHTLELAQERWAIPQLDIIHQNGKN